MIRVGRYARKRGALGAMLVVGIIERPLTGGKEKGLFARCRYPNHNPRVLPPFYYVTLPLAELEEAQVMHKCGVCGKPATHENGKMATMFFCTEHARPGHTRIES